MATDVPQSPPPTWDPTVMAEAISEFRVSGSPAAVLRALGTCERLAMPVLQRALKRTTTSDERQAFEDVAFALSTSHRRMSLEPRTRAITAAREYFGENVIDFVDVVRFVDGFVTALDSEPAPTAIAAAIGLEAARRIASPLPVSGSDGGSQISVTLVTCNQCAKDLGRPGWVVCRPCLARAQVVGGGTRSDAAHPVDLLIRRQASFGCAECHRQPVQPCDCLRSVTVPAHPREGQLVKGVRVRTHEECWFTLVLDGDR
jgi:hypothetical protein